MTPTPLQGAPKTTRGRFYGHIATGALLAGCALVATLSLGLILGRWRLVPVKTGSMAPSIPAGAAVIATPEPIDALRPGQIIIYHSPEPDGRTIAHRLVHIERDQHTATIQTKGDANSSADPWTATLRSGPVWRVRHVIPLAGRLIELLRSRIAQALILSCSTLGLIVAAAPTLRRRHRHRQVVMSPAVIADPHPRWLALVRELREAVDTIDAMAPRQCLDVPPRDTAADTIETKHAENSRDGLVRTAHNN